MANGIYHSFPTGETVYAFIRRKSDDFIYDVVAGSDTFESFNVVNIANYDLVMADDGGNFYSVDFPSGISAGIHRISIFQQDTGAPLLADNVIAEGEFHWDGTLEIDITTISSDVEVVISDLTVISSDVLVGNSNIDSISSDLTIVGSDVISVGSDVDTVLETVRIQLNEFNLDTP